MTPNLLQTVTMYVKEWPASNHFPLAANNHMVSPEQFPWSNAYDNYHPRPLKSSAEDALIRLPTGL